MAAAPDHAETWKDFRALVNMAPATIEKWLKTDESKEVGYKDDDGKADESVGHASGRRIIKILRTRKAELSDDDYDHMRKVVGYIRRHTAQHGPAHDKKHSAWRYSLMNWGHDPLK